MTDLIDTVQLQEVDDSLVELFDITLPNGTVVYLFNGMEGADNNNIYFPEKTISGSTYNLKEYIALPIEIEGIDLMSDGPQARPTLRLANIPSLSRSISNGSDGTADEETLKSILDAEGIESNIDLLDTKVIYRRTLFSHTYKEPDSDPTTAPVEFPSSTYIVDRVASENAIVVEFELVSPADIEGVVIPGRVIIGKYCPWRYQGYFAAGEGGCHWPLDSNGRFYDVNDDVITKDITTINAYNSSSTYTAGNRVKTTSNNTTKIWEARTAVPTNRDPNTNGAYWLRLDVCGKLISSCKVRFQGNSTDDTLDTSHCLPFGGFPGTKQFK